MTTRFRVLAYNSDTVNPDIAPHRAQIRRHGLSEQVRLDAGYVADADVPRYFAAADVGRVALRLGHAERRGADCLSIR